MTESTDWTWLRSVPKIDMATYLAMPVEVSRVIEVKDGFPVVCESPSPNHAAITSTLEQALRAAVRKRQPHEPCLKVSRDVDMLVSEVPFNFRTPDVIVYRCIAEPRGKWQTKPTSADAVLVIEVVSPSTVTTDCVDKRAEYAHLGIEQYWIVRMDNNNGPVKSIEILRLNSDGEYVNESRFRSHDSVTAVTVSDPLDAVVTWQELDADLD
ncbi:Uma2 family endonuclease [Nocardia sp. NPDC127579]|uniref:Uma2 family endonuclease n=1 Tax=Nocardia sp. NPDC127579 TaxID=3345402 RepID=UPI0036389E2C